MNTTGTTTATTSPRSRSHSSPDSDDEHQLIHNYSLLLNGGNDVNQNHAVTVFHLQQIFHKRETNDAAISFIL